MCVRAHVQARKCFHVCICACVQVCVFACVYVCVFMCVWVCVCVCVCAQMASEPCNDIVSERRTLAHTCASWSQHLQTNHKLTHPHLSQQQLKGNNLILKRHLMQYCCCTCVVALLSVTVDKVRQMLHPELPEMTAEVAVVGLFRLLTQDYFEQLC